MSDCWVDDLRRWHEARLAECGYPREVFYKLSHEREQWLASSGAVCCREKSVPQRGVGGG